MTMIRPGPIEQLVEATLEPGDLGPGTFIRRPQSESINSEGTLTPEMPGMVVVDLQSAGWTYLYDTKTREPSLCNNNAVLTQLSAKREDGSLVFTRTKPSTPPWRGTYKCMLHADSRGALPKDLESSFRFCSKSNIPNTHEVMMHMQYRHHNEWLAIERDREERERREDREVQRQMIEALAGRAIAPQTYLPVDPKSTVKRVRTPEEIEQTKARMAKVRAGIKQ